MREIKFRAWDSGKKEWLKEFVLMEDGELGLFPGHKTNPLYIEVMQFTGLLDKSGKEIYEGDILRFAIPICASLPPQGYTVIVAFDCGCFGFYPTHPDDVHEDDKSWKSFWREEDHAIWDGNFFEVIGNIHEHRHLLEDNNAKRD